MTGQPNNIFALDKQAPTGPGQISPEENQGFDPNDPKSDLQAQTDILIPIFSVSAAFLFFFLFIWFLSKSP
jgi:hypothetical protein